MTPASKHKLIVMRHAKSDWSAPVASDFDRVLAKRGYKNAPRMGGWLAEQGLIPGLIVSSPAMRARQTAQLVAEKLEIPERDILWEPELYMASLATLLSVINKYVGRTGALMLIGHNPGLDSLVKYLSDRRPDYHDGKLMTTAAVAVFDFGEGGITTNKQGARLERLVRPKDLW
jgi:phosphohistidine phosphatase